MSNPYTNSTWCRLKDIAGVVMCDVGEVKRALKWLEETDRIVVVKHAKRLQILINPDIYYRDGAYYKKLALEQWRKVKTK